MLAQTPSVLALLTAILLNSLWRLPSPICLSLINTQSIFYMIIRMVHLSEIDHDNSSSQKAGASNGATEFLIWPYFPHWSLVNHIYRIYTLIFYYPPLLDLSLFLEHCKRASASDPYPIAFETDILFSNVSIAYSLIFSNMLLWVIPIQYT